MADSYTAFVLARRAQNVTPGTLAFYQDKLYPFTLWATENGAPAIDQVTAEIVRAYLVSLQQRGLSLWTVHGAARAIRTFLRFCAEDGMIDAAPRFSMPKLPKRILPAFEPADVQRLLGACDHERDAAIVLFLLDTGLRAAEFCALNGADVDVPSGGCFGVWIASNLSAASLTGSPP